jgi:HTH-type transcriptional regulator, transcriptional repressor of NAD biosynthesis genes
MPLHRGHEHLIATALSQCDDLTILVYDSEAPATMPLEKRVGWVQSLYPDVGSIVPVPDPLTGNPDRNSPRHARVYADALRFLGRFDRVFTSEPAYRDFAALLGARHVVVDEARSLVPVSGTEIRSDPYAHRTWMDPRVYASLVGKVVFVGTESTGKSTIAKALAARYDTLWTHEYGRELWEAQGLQGTFEDHLSIALRQHEREETARPQARRFLFCDTNAWTTLQWSLRSYGTADARLTSLVDDTIGEYTWFLCADDFPWVQDGTRELVDGESGRFQEQQRRDLDARGIRYTLLTGPLERRLEQVERALGLDGPRGPTVRASARPGATAASP